jgi:hypothetical protein
MAPDRPGSSALYIPAHRHTRQKNVKCGAASGMNFQPNPSLHQFHQLPADGQTQAGSPIFCVDIGRALLKGFKHELLFVFRESPYRYR